MRRVRLKSPPDADYLQALKWYEERQPGLGCEFDAELQALFERIKQNPKLFSKETAFSQRSSVLATLGFGTESRWDSHTAAIRSFGHAGVCANLHLPVWFENFAGDHARRRFMACPPVKPE